jgi:hypothetical protein
MFDWLISLLIVFLLLIWILDYLDLLDGVSTLLRGSSRRSLVRRRSLPFCSASSSPP